MFPHGSHNRRKPRHHPESLFRNGCSTWFSPSLGHTKFQTGKFPPGDGEDLVLDWLDSTKESKARSLPVGFSDVAAGLVGGTRVGIAGEHGFVSLHGQIAFLQQVVHLSGG